MKIAVFYHVARLGTWQAVDAQIIDALKSSGLIDRADVFIRNECDPNVYEFPTIDMVREFAATNDAYIFYLHTKGVTHPKPCVDDWRESMLYWMVTRWEECVAKLSRFDAVGYSHIETPIPHFQGNFWWARSEHIRKLGDPRDIKFVPTVKNQGERHKAEFWLLSKPGKWYQPYHHRINPYCTRNPRSNYEGRAF